MTKGRGRPQLDFNWATFDAILQYGATQGDAAEILGVSEDTITRAIKREHKLKFSEYRHTKMGRVRIKLLQKQYDVAMSGNVTMLIWLGKQHLGQSDKVETKSVKGFAEGLDELKI